MVDAVQRMLATPSEFKPVDDNEVGADDIESSENPHDYSARDVDAPEPAQVVARDVPTSSLERRFQQSAP